MMIMIIDLSDHLFINKHVKKNKTQRKCNGQNGV